jgi:hypothetical protein
LDIVIKSGYVCATRSGFEVLEEAQMTRWFRVRPIRQSAWEIRVASILNLDRAEKAVSEDQEHDELHQEETAA